MIVQERRNKRTTCEAYMAFCPGSLKIQQNCIFTVKSALSRDMNVPRVNIQLIIKADNPTRTFNRWIRKQKSSVIHSTNFVSCLIRSETFTQLDWHPGTQCAGKTHDDQQSFISFCSSQLNIFPLLNVIPPVITKSPWGFSNQKLFFPEEEHMSINSVVYSRPLFRHWYWPTNTAKFSSAQGMYRRIQSLTNNSRHDQLGYKSVSSHIRFFFLFFFFDIHKRRIMCAYTKTGWSINTL